MRFAIISDIHGNFPALVNVINDARLNGADEFIFIGDYIFDLPYSNEVTQLLTETQNARIIQGNKETYLKQMVKEDQSTWTGDQFAVLYQTFRELTKENFDFLTGLDEEIYIQANPSTRVYATHFFNNIPTLHKELAWSSVFHKRMLESPLSHEEYLTEYAKVLNTEAYAAEINKIDAQIILNGHNHLQGYGYAGDKLIINPGSCGLPLDFMPTSAYTILELTEGLPPKVIEKRVAYDAEAIVKDTKESALYSKGRIWCELVFMALRTGRDYYGVMFETARSIANAKKETGGAFSNETWKEAYAELRANQLLQIPFV